MRASAEKSLSFSNKRKDTIMEPLAKVGTSILSAVSAFDKGSLKVSSTSITTRDGVVFEESLNQDGTYSRKLLHKNKKDMKYLEATNDKQQFEKSQPRIDVTPSPRFDIHDPQMLAYLQEFGYVVVRNVVDEDQIRAATDLVWQFLESSAGWKREDSSTWTTESFAKIGMPQTGIINGAGVGQSKAQWYIRCLPTVQAAFQKVWSSHMENSHRDKHAAVSLLTSFDGINVYRPWRDNAEWKTVGGWTHVDQGRSKHGFHCIQGLVSLTNSTPETGGLVVMPGTHEHHSAFINSHATNEFDFARIPRDSPSLPKEMRNCIRLVTASAGDLILWDSRTIHDNTPAISEAAEEKSRPDELLRIVSYICMTPSIFASNKVLEQRNEAYRRNITTSHWPHHAPDLSNGCNQSSLDTVKVAPTDEIKKLIGCST